MGREVPPTEARRVRVAVTREEELNGPFSTALAAAGFEPLLCAAVMTAPALDTEALARAARELESYDWLIVASARAVTALMAARDGVPPPATLRAGAVGESTAQALRRAGVREVRFAERAGAQGLIEVLKAADSWRGRRVLLPRAEEGRRDLAEALQHWGATVTEVVAYRTVARTAEQLARCWEKTGPQAAVFASPSAVESLVAALGADALRKLDAVVAIGPTTAAALERAGVPVHVSGAANAAAAAECVRRVLGDRS
jgi:uroporphyrinogen-III synthase